MSLLEASGFDEADLLLLAEIQKSALCFGGRTLTRKRFSDFRDCLPSRGIVAVRLVKFAPKPRSCSWRNLAEFAT